MRAATVLLLALGAANAAAAAAIESSTAAAEEPRRHPAWQVTGGELGFDLNQDLLRQYGLGVRFDDAARADGDFVVVPITDADVLAFAAPTGNLHAFESGALRLGATIRLQRRDGKRLRIDAPRLRARAGAAPPVLDLVDRSGRAWFYVDRIMYALDPDAGTLRMLTMDLRIAPALAAWLKAPELAGNAIADLRMSTRILRVGHWDKAMASCSSPNWPGSGGGAYYADVLLTDMGAQQMRCRQRADPSALCDGPGGDDGEVVVAPDATLQNTSDTNGGAACTAADPCTADIPWYAKFQTSPWPYPYPGNDQHPYLVWNLYRIADGRIEQIGRSGVKHAFFSINFGCNCPGGNVLGVSCGDIYSTGNNDGSTFLGPRRELIPHTGQWGRCGSIFDDEDTNPGDGLPGCDGIQDPGGNDNYMQRLVTRESQIDPAANPGAAYWLESWYVVRDDVNIYNTMGHIPLLIGYTESGWMVTRSFGGPFTPGPVIDRWVPPGGADPLARSAELATSHGRARAAVRVTALGGGLWRYDYALMNFTWGRPHTLHAEPNLRVVSNRGFTGFAVPAQPAATITQRAFADGDLEAGNDWTSALVSGAPLVVRWDAPVSAPLDWGTLFRYSFVANLAPRAGSVWIEAGVDGSHPAVSYALPLLVPGETDPDRLHADGFEF